MIRTSGKKETKERLEILNKSNDGFEIADWDLKLRGPGDFFGIRQSGEMNFKIGDIYSDATTLKQAAEAVSSVEEQRDKIEKQDIQMLNCRLEKYITGEFRLNL